MGVLIKAVLHLEICKSVLIRFHSQRRPVSEMPFPSQLNKTQTCCLITEKSFTIGEREREREGKREKRDFKSDHHYHKSAVVIREHIIHQD